MLALIRKTIAPAQLKPQYENVLLSRIDLYEQVFTSASVDPVKNYEMYETLGDSTANKFITWYFFKRFPQLNCPDGVEVLSRLKITYASKRSFSKIAEKLGFWPFIKHNEPLTELRRRSLLEDVFEAFIGLTELLLDEYFMVGVGWAVCYDILKSIFDEMDVSLKYDDLVDAKSRLKELFDKNPQLGTISYTHTPNISFGYRITTTGEKIEMGKSSKSVHADREKEIATSGLNKLSKEGIVTKHKSYNLICE